MSFLPASRFSGVSLKLSASPEVSFPSSVFVQWSPVHPGRCLTRHLPPTNFQVSSATYSSPELAFPPGGVELHSWGSRPVLKLAALVCSRESALKSADPVTNRRQHTPMPGTGMYALPWDHAGSHPFFFRTTCASDILRTPLTNASHRRGALGGGGTKEPTNTH